MNQNPSTSTKKASIHSSIRNKILMLSAAIVIPFFVLTAVLLVCMSSYRKQYQEIVSNIAVANDYNLNFKEEMDESLYKLVVGYISYEDIGKDPSLQDPYQMIRKLKTEFTKLKDVTTEPDSRWWLDSLLRNIDTLEKRVDDIFFNIQIGGRYDENIRELDNNIYILTELIQDNIQYYIYYQIRSMETMTGALNQQIRQFILVCSVLALVLILVIVSMTYLITANLLRPIKVLHDTMKKISAGDFSARAKVQSKDELESLADGFNAMTGNMQGMINKIKEDEQKMRHLDLRLLQEQINPHFLYNTLDTIVWLIEGNKPDDAVNMVVTLSDFFRLVLSKGKEFISIREEERHIRSYLEIQEMRYRDILEYEICIDPLLYQYEIPKLTMQPLVENALYHGIKYKREKGCICVSGHKEEENLILVVEDDGSGMTKEELCRLQQEILRPCRETEHGFGLANVNERIRMYFGAEYGMKIQSKKGMGTRVTITIPARRNEQHAKTED